MAEAQIRDFLGHVCQLTELHRDLDDTLDDVRTAYAGEDPRHLVRAIGCELRALWQRHEQCTAALQAIPRPADDDGGTGAMLDMAAEYSLRTANRYADLMALVLVALERGEGYPEHLKPGAT